MVLARFVVYTFVLPIALSATVSFAQAADVRDFAYDARLAFIKAGELNLQLSRFADQHYEVNGEFHTSRAMSLYYSWNGVFAALGQWDARKGPTTEAFIARTESKDDDYTVTLTHENGARQLKGQDAEFEDIEQPKGNDLISAVFFSPVCYEDGLVHDGEDTYRLELRRQKRQRLSAGEEYFKGEVTNCDYVVHDRKGRKRRVIVSLADVGGEVMAVQVRAKIPVLPDAIFRLRMPSRDIVSR